MNPKSSKIIIDTVHFEDGKLITKKKEICLIRALNDLNKEILTGYPDYKWSLDDKILKRGNMTDKEKYYFERTLNHIHLVQKCGLFLVLNHSREIELSSDDCRKFMEQILNHDRSKFNLTQFQPYIDFSWSMKPGTNYKLSSDQEEDFEKAWRNHFLSENHHPIGNEGASSNLILLEMCCDLQAMAIEFNEKSYRKYYNEKWKKSNCKFYRITNWNYVKDFIEKILYLFETEKWAEWQRDIS